MRACLVLLALTACRGVQGDGVVPVELQTSQELPAAWDSSPASAFEEQVARLAAAPVRWSDAGLRALTAALDDPGPRATRAAVLLGQDPGPPSTEALIARLERRQDHAVRALDAGDIVAAAALTARGVEERLVALAVGDAPHPDLEIRVECARAALHAGREEVVPFLLTVLRALTPAEREHPADWERTTTLMWAKSRAAEALCARLGIPCEVRPDGSWEDQVAEADRLEALFAR